MSVAGAEDKPIPITFLQAVNASLRRVRAIQGDAGELATSTVTSTATGLVATDAFTDSGRQSQIDIMLQLWQEAEHTVYELGIFASGMASATIALASDVRSYSLPSDFERMAGETSDERVWRGATNSLIVKEYTGGYARLLADRPVATDYIGDPQHWALDPVSGNMTFDTFANDGNAGNVYNALYHKRLFLTSTMATETFPFSDTVVDALVPVVAEGWQRVFKKEFDSGLFRSSMTRAIKTTTRTTNRSRYGPRRAV